ncbi:MAG: alpha/beta hydrolase [Hydrogenophaga sp.]|nr:alpha/beta hydrolase [Hydrogenophaga sp.]
MDGLDTAMAQHLRELGNGFNLPAVQALYAPLLQAQAREGVVPHADLRYGTHDRHRLDLYLPASPGPHPVLVWLHGGGFIRGDKQQCAHVGWWAARSGFAAVLPNYRLAPKCVWPSGPQDVVRLWTWLQTEGSAWGVDPQRVVLAGESAGAAHVAAAALMRPFQPPGWHIQGAALLSGPYNARLEGLAQRPFGIEHPDPRNTAYFGSDTSAWARASTVDHIDAAPFPLWLGYAERDLLQMQVQAGELFARLVTQHGFRPELHLVRDHNHFSASLSLATADQRLSASLLAFLRQTLG